MLLPRVPLEPRLVLALRERAKREVEHLDREPAAQRVERAVDHGVVSAREPDLAGAPRWITLRIGL